MKIRKFALCLVLGSLSGLLLENALAKTGSPELFDDGRFAAFDTREYVVENHVRLAARAEVISHWAGYYRLNPILLVGVLDRQFEHQAPSARQVEGLAKRLSREFDSTLERTDSRQTVATRIASILGISTEEADETLLRVSLESTRSGMDIPMAEADDVPPALDLPFARPQAWQFNGVHTWTGADNDTPMSSLDFTRAWSLDWGDDTANDWVTASHDGVVNVFSSCFVQVQHDSGWGTRYYHLDNVQVETGQRVLAGDLIGIYASDSEQAICSGGSSTGPHLHFALLQNGQYTSLQDVELSGYRVHPGTSSYDANRERMWLEKRDQRYFAFDLPIATEEGDNTIDYRYNGMWFSPASNGHGFNVEISEFPGEEGSRNVAFVVMYTYDDSGQANFYTGNVDYDRWRSDEGMVIDILQTSGGDFTNLGPIDFENPDDVRVAGQAEIGFFDCENGWVELSLEERETGQVVEHYVELVKLIGVPRHVCEGASVALPVVE